MVLCNNFPTVRFISFLKVPARRERHRKLYCIKYYVVRGHPTHLTNDYSTLLRLTIAQREVETGGPQHGTPRLGGLDRVR